MLTRAAIMTVLGHDARKQVERGLGCSRSQAWRMVYHGRIPGKFRQALIAFLDRSIERNLGTLAAIRRELAEIEHEEMLARAARRHADSVDSPQAALPGLDQRSKESAVRRRP